MNELDPFGDAIAGLLVQLEPGERRRLAAEIARRLRAAQQRRIAANLNPDGSAYAPRSPTLRRKRGALRRVMFSRLRTARWLKVAASPQAAVVAFVAQVQRIAQVHQHGLHDRVNRLRGPMVQYPERRLLGMNDADVESVEDVVLAHLAARA